MLKLLGATVVSTAMVMAVSASAADLRRPVYKSSEPIPYTWTGLYVGAHAGGSWADNEFFDVVGGGEAAKFTAQGHFGGVQIGYNWQTGRWVLGAEFEGSLSHLRRGVLGGFCGGFQPIGCSGQQCGGFQNFGCNFGGGGCIPLGFGNFGCAGQLGARVQSLVLLSARLGYAVDRTLYFVKGGAALAHDKYVVNIAGVLSATPTDDRWGWIVGAGIEYGLTPNWSIKVEYDYIDLGTQRLSFLTAGGVAFAFDQSQQVHLAKGGINYRF
jgi:outer membrane immunogenic protein